MRLSHRRQRRTRDQSHINRLANLVGALRSREDILRALRVIHRRRRGGYSKAYRPWIESVMRDRFSAARPA